MYQVSAIKAFSDNYIWAIHDQAGHCVVVDPGQATPVTDWLRETGNSLCGILITHHHWDHTGGIAELTKNSAIPVIGPANPEIKGVTQAVSDADTVTLPGLGIDLQVFAVPGHTLDHLAFYNAELAWLFCGDTLFHCGCGRLFEGSPEQMHASLQKLTALPLDTQLYCTHEYTLANMEFALAADPSNPELLAAQRRARLQREHDEPTLPSNIGEQLLCNPFVRTDKPGVIDAAQTQVPGATTPIEVFAALRSWKDNF